jgi:RNA polymerase sigma factor (sigma-70 family)
MTDEKLLADYLSHRDELAFEALVRRYGPMVFRVSRDILGDREHAEDAFQATFLVLSRQAGSIHQHRSLNRWLYEVACRISRRERRRLDRLRSQERQVPEMESAASPDFDPADRELKPILHEEIGRLPSKLRDAIVLCYFDGLTMDAAAQRIGCPVSTFKSRLRKGRDLLRSRLARRGVAAAVLLLLMMSLTEESSAAVPDSLLDDTVKGTSTRLGSIGVSRRIALMVLHEEARKGWVRMTVSWSLLVFLLLVFGTSRMALGSKAEAAPSNPLVAWADSVGIDLSRFFPLAPASNPELMPSRDHCVAP